MTDTPPESPGLRPMRLIQRVAFVEEILPIIPKLALAQEAHKDAKVYCKLLDIKALCAHTGPKPEAAPKPGTAKPEAAPKAGGAGGPRLAKEVAAPPAPPGSPPARPVPRTLLLQVVPTALEEDKGSAESHHVKVSPHSAEVGPVKAQVGSGQGDRVTLEARMEGSCGDHPKWVIADHTLGKVVTEVGAKVTHPFLPPGLPLRGAKPFAFASDVFWLEGVAPRRYQVTCEAPERAQAAHYLLDIEVYPSTSSTLKLDSKAIKKPPWEANLEHLKGQFQSLFNHVSTLIPVLPKAEIELLDGDLSLKNGWEEVSASNLACWKADVDADLELIKVALEFQVSIFKFLKAAQAVVKMAQDAKRLEDFFEKKFGLYVEAGLFLTVAVSIALKGKGGWEKEAGGKAVAHMEEFKAEEGASVKLEARLDVGYKKEGTKGDLAQMSGSGTSTLTLSVSPRLEAGPHFWLDSDCEWQPLTLELSAKVHAPLKAKTDPPEKGVVQEKPLTKSDVKSSEAEQPSLLDLRWKGEVLPKVKKGLPSLDLLSGATGMRPAGAHESPLAVVPRIAPPTKPALPTKPAPPVKP